MISSAFLLGLLVYPFLLVAAHVVLCRLYAARHKELPSSPQKFLIGLILWFNVPLIAGSAFIGIACSLEEAIFTVVFALLFYNGSAYAYFHFFNMSDTGRRVRMMIEIRKLGSVDLTEFGKMYSPAGMIQTRIGRLEAAKQIKKGADGRYRMASPVLVWVDRCLELLRSILGFTKEEEREKKEEKI